MHAPSRYGRLKAVPRVLTLLTVLSLSGAAASAAPQSLAGTIVDQNGRPVPHARVVLIAAGAVAQTTTSDESGRFTLTEPADLLCRLEARLTGFKVATLPCTTPPPVRVTLTVAPIAESIVVTPTRTDAPAGQVGAGVTTFTAEDLARRRDPMVSDLLRTTPGAMVLQSGSTGSVTSLFVRGGESNYNKVLLDGIPLNEPGGTFNFGNLTTSQLDRVEIVRGAQSALFGSDAVASVVQLFTKRADRADTRAHLSAGIEAGGYGTFNANASLSRNMGKGDFLIGVSQFHTDNLGQNSGFENTAVSATAGVELGSSATLRFVGRGEFGRAGTPGQTAFGRPDLDASSDRHDGIGGVTFDQQVTRSIRQRASYSLAYSRQLSQNLKIDPPYTPQFDGHVAPFEFDDFPYDLATRLRRHHASYQADIHLHRAAKADHLLTALADWDGERMTIEDALAPSTTTASRNNVGVSLQEQALWSRVFATVSGRLEHNDSFGIAMAPRASVVFVVHQAHGTLGETRVHTSAGLGIKEPTTLQSFSPPPFEGNRDLKPERSRTAEVGVEQRLAADRVRLDATWFDNRFRNIISTQTLSFNPYHAQYVNIGRTRARGAELGIELVATQGVRATAGYTFLDSEVVESTSPLNVVFAQGASLFRRPRHSGYLGISLSHKHLSADLTGTLIGHYVDSDFSSLTPPLLVNAGRKTLDARASYALTPRLTVIGSVDNVTNDSYMEPLGYKTLGRSARLGVRTSF